MTRQDAPIRGHRNSGAAGHWAFIECGADTYRDFMPTKPFRCKVGLHSYVREHPPDERPHRPGGEVCRLCGKHRGEPGIPQSILGS